MSYCLHVYEWHAGLQSHEILCKSDAFYDLMQTTVDFTTSIFFIYTIDFTTSNHVFIMMMHKIFNADHRV